MVPTIHDFPIKVESLADLGAVSLLVGGFWVVLAPQLQVPCTPVIHRLSIPNHQQSYFRTMEAWPYQSHLNYGADHL